MDIARIQQLLDMAVRPSSNPHEVHSSMLVVGKMLQREGLTVRDLGVASRPIAVPFVPNSVMREKVQGLEASLDAMTKERDALKAEVAKLNVRLNTNSKDVRHLRTTVKRMSRKEDVVIPLTPARGVDRVVKGSVSVKREILRILLENPAGLTDEQINARRNGQTINTTRPRRNDLLLQGFVKRAGSAKTLRGRPESLWQADGTLEEFEAAVERGRAQTATPTSVPPIWKAGDDRRPRHA